MIYCDELVKMYQSDGLKVLALQGLDMEIKKGEMVAIIGKSGSGKSTLLNMLGGLETPTAGRLLIDDRELSTYTEKELVHYRRNTVGFVWQKSSRNLLPYLTVRENVEAPMLYEKKLSKKEKRARAMELLTAVGMERYADSLPLKLSGGEQQRVAIAVALANRPSVLLADEPTGAVDTKTADHIFELFQKLNREMGLTILIVTHDMRLADKVNRVLMISDGKISTEKLRTKEYDAAALWQESKEELHEEYSVLDKANRVQLTDEMLQSAGIEGKKVKIEVEDGRILIQAERSATEKYRYCQQSYR